MAAFTVHEPPVKGATSSERAESLVFVRDGFSWRALLFGPFYFLLRGEWLGLLAYAAAVTISMLILKLLGAEDDWLGSVIVLIHVIAGFEASQFQRWSLSRANWDEVGAVSGRGIDQAERRFFEAWLPDVPAATLQGDRRLSSGYDTIGPGDFVSRAEQALRRKSDSLRSRFAPKT